MSRTSNVGRSGTAEIPCVHDRQKDLQLLGPIRVAVIRAAIFGSDNGRAREYGNPSGPRPPCRSRGLGAKLLRVLGAFCTAFRLPTIYPPFADLEPESEA